jgi:DNA polymerase elongation subunit (family B)
MELTFIPIDYDYFDYEGRNYAKIIGRTLEGKRACVIDKCDVYFWTILKQGTNNKQIENLKEKILKLKVESANRTTKVIKVEDCSKNFLGKPVQALKIFISNYKDAHAIADLMDYEEIEARREYDLGYITQYIRERKLMPLQWHKISGQLTSEFGIDNLDVDLCVKVDEIKPANNEDFKPKILAFDIEADEFEVGAGEILMISLYSEKTRKILTWKKSDLNFVECYKDEAEMLEAFVQLVKQESPDILVGYYSDGFDLPYLRTRAQKLGVKLDLGLDNSQPRISGSLRTSVKIDGIVHIDLFRFIETAYSQYLQSETLSLNEVASELLGEKKLEHEFKHSSKIEKDEWKPYFEYNLQDSLLTYKLLLKAWPDLQEFSRIMQEPLHNICRDSMSAHVENYIIHNLEKFNEIAEKRPIHEEINKRRAREKYEGAFVFQPQPGLYENLAMFDFTSMYASVIVSFNLSKSTLSDKKEGYEVNLPTGAVFFSKKPGFFPLMLQEVIEKRRKYKKEFQEKKDNMARTRSNAYKLLANASYGYLGFFGARYYCLEAAASTAALARKYIQETIEKIEKEGFKVTYSDTDSIALLLGNKTKEKALELLKTLNKNLPGIMELDLEDFYKRGIWVTKRTGDFGAKKKYALITEQGKLRIRGFETVRRDWCQLARNLQSTILKKILDEGNQESALEYFKLIVKNLKERKIDKKEIMIKTQLKKAISEYKAISPHVVAAQKMKEQGIPVDDGMLIEFFIAETREKKALVREKVKLPDEKGEYNIEYYLEHQIIPAVENIFQVFNINLKEIVSGKKQKSLGDF